jgi:hypothetical protein
MKNYKYWGLLVIIMSAALSACGTNQSDTAQNGTESIISEYRAEAESELEPETETVAEVETVPETETEIGSESDSEKIAFTDEEYEYVLEKFNVPSFAECTMSALDDIGFQEINGISYEDVKLDGGAGGDIRMVIILTDIDEKQIRMHCSYLSVIDTWIVSNIYDYVNGNCYWITEGAEGMQDMYDYRTGELVSERSDSRTWKEYLSDVKAENDAKDEETAQEFEDSMDAIAEKYGLQR